MHIDSLIFLQLASVGQTHANKDTSRYVSNLPDAGHRTYYWATTPHDHDGDSDDDDNDDDDHNDDEDAAVSNRTEIIIISW